LLSGLALAGANLPNHPDEDDGILSAMEVAAMDLSNVELSVLSACQTAQGKEAFGEGVFGLQRAFQVAGSRSVVATQWPISDEATRILMMRFYRNLWEKKMTKLEALRDAQLWMISGARKAAKAGESPQRINLDSDKLPPSLLHPAIWAPFQLSGDWR
jgi:CHAT domain-containing protein